MNKSRKKIFMELVVGDVTCQKCVNRINNSLTKANFNVITVNPNYELKQAYFIISLNEINLEKLNQIIVNASNGTSHSYHIISVKLRDNDNY